MTIGEILDAYNGFQIRESRSWERTRQLIYTVACLASDKNKHIDIYDFFPLPTDPTPEERKELEEKKRQELIDSADEVFAYYKSLGYLN